MVRDLGPGLLKDPVKFTDTLIPVTEHEHNFQPEWVTDGFEHLVHVDYILII